MKLLFISYNHQNPIYADVVQNNRLIKELVKSEEVHICCRKHKLGNELYPIHSPDLFLLSRVLWVIFPFLRFMFDIDTFTWSVIAYNKLKKIVSEYDKIIITYAPYSIFYLPKWLNKKKNVEVISLMYDSLVENCFFEPSARAHSIRTRIEKQIFEMSKKCIVNNYKYYHTLQEKPHTEGKLEYLPLVGINNFIKPECKLANNEKLVISHAGSVHGARRLNELIEVVERLISSMNKLKVKLEIHIYGRCSEHERKKIVDNGLDTYFKLHSYCKQDVLIEELTKADALLLIDPLCEGNYSFPSKLCEYSQYDKLIIALSSKDSPSYQFLKEHGHKAFSVSELQDLEFFLIKLLNDKNELQKDYDRNMKDYFEPSRVCSQLLNIICCS